MLSKKDFMKVTGVVIFKTKDAYENESDHILHKSEYQYLENVFEILYTDNGWLLHFFEDEVHYSDDDVGPYSFVPHSTYYRFEFDVWKE